MPKFSIYTPTNDSKWLLETYRSLFNQSCQDFEWIILPNGARPPAIPSMIADDPKVKLLPATGFSGIGAAKGDCCKACTGEILVELDHDDTLMPDCLETLYDEYQKAEDKNCFIFSDCITYYPDYSSETYMPEHGWEHYDYTFEDHSYKVAKSFPISARSLCEIFYAPHHVRAWSRSAYTKAGRYDRKMMYADDHDLICRTYLTGAEFRHVDRPLYMYRRHDRNNCAVDGEKVYKDQLRNMNKYTHLLVFEWCRRNKLRMIDLGGAHNSPALFESLDVTGDVKIKCNVLGPDFKELITNDSVGVFRAWDFLEHLSAGDSVIELMNRLYRKLAPGGWLISSTPAICDDEGKVGRGAFQDPTHLSQWSSNNFWYFTRQEFAKFIPSFKGRFQPVRVWHEYPSQFHFANQIPYVMADLVALKGQHEAGESFM